MKECSVVIPADFRFNASLRNISECAFAYAGFGNRAIQRLVLVFDELFMNAIKYGSDGPEDSIHIFFEWEEGEYIRVRIEDEGKQLSRTAAEELKKKMNKEFLNHNPSKSSGRGLAQIVLNLTDDLQIIQSSFGGISVTFMKKVSLSENED
ncbi:MAG: ATP-binding protein [Candidatus Peregrinibacteria bacterium]